MPRPSLFPAEPSPARQPALTHGADRVPAAEDLDLLRDFTRSFLQAVGLTVLSAATASEALILLKNEPAPDDLIFTDPHMPGMDGNTPCSRLGLPG